MDKNYNLLKDELAVSGLEMTIDPFSAITGILGIGSSVAGAASSSSAAKKQAKAQNKAIKAQHKYNKEAWRMNKSRLKADREFAIEGIEIAQRNEAKLKDLKDTQALQNYETSLQIRNLQMRQASKQYERSLSLYNNQKNFNQQAANEAIMGEYNRMNEAMQQAAFQNQDLFVQALQEQGQAYATGQAGNSVARAALDPMSALGRNQAIIAENLISTGRGVRNNMARIGAQKEGADFQAFSNLMMPVETPISPFAPLETPVTEYQMPRELEDFDFGPEPVKGAMAVANTSAPWLNALGSVSQSIAGMFTNTGPQGFGGYTNNSIGIPSFGSSNFNLTANNIGNLDSNFLTMF